MSGDQHHPGSGAGDAVANTALNAYISAKANATRFAPGSADDTTDGLAGDGAATADDPTAGEPEGPGPGERP